MIRCELPIKHLPDRTVLDVVKISAEVDLEDPPLIGPVFPIIVLEILLASEHGEVYALALEARAVIVYETAAQDRD